MTIDMTLKSYSVLEKLALQSLEQLGYQVNWSEREVTSPKGHIGIIRHIGTVFGLSWIIKVRFFGIYNDSFCHYYQVFTMDID